MESFVSISSNFLLMCFCMSHSTLSETLRTCNYALSCESESIFVSNGSDTSRIECRAGGACLDSTALLASGDTDTQLVRCSGSLSCYSSQSIISLAMSSDTTNIGKITCDGYYSCAASNLFSEDAIECSGSFSCANSALRSIDTFETFVNLNASDYNFDPSDASGSTNISYNSSFQTSSILEDFSPRLEVSCSGTHACAGTSIQSVRNVSGGGELSLEFGSIWSNGSDLTVSLSGRGAGRNLNVFCDDVTEVCEVVCFGTGCFETYLHCDESAQGTQGAQTCGFDCKFADVCGYICVAGECVLANVSGIAATLIDFDDLSYFGLSTGQTLADRVVWDGSEWEALQREFVAGLVGNVDVSESARDCGVLSVVDGSAASGASVKSKFVCDAYGPAGECYELSKSLINPNGSVCCLGFQSCAFAQSADVFLEASEASEVACDGAETCRQAYMRAAGSVYCSGWDSCRNSRITGKIGNDTNGWNSRVYCDGSGACAQADLTALQYLYCSGRNACAQSRISAVEWIEAAATDALHGAWIESGGDGNETKIWIRAPYAATNGTVFCKDGDTCRIVCESVFACAGLTLVCEVRAGDASDRCGVECQEGAECARVVFEFLGQSVETTRGGVPTLETSETTETSETSETGGFIEDETESREENGVVVPSNENTLRWAFEIVAGLLVVLLLTLLSCYVYHWQKLKLSLSGSDTWNSVANVDVDEEAQSSDSDADANDMLNKRSIARIRVSNDSDAEPEIEDSDQSSSGEKIVLNFNNAQDGQHLCQAYENENESEHDSDELAIRNIADAPENGADFDAVEVLVRDGPSGSDGSDAPEQDKEVLPPSVEVMDELEDAYQAVETKTLLQGVVRNSLVTLSPSATAAADETFAGAGATGDTSSESEDSLPLDSRVFYN